MSFFIAAERTAMKNHSVPLIAGGLKAHAKAIMEMGHRFELTHRLQVNGFCFSASPA